MSTTDQVANVFTKSLQPKQHAACIARDSQTLVAGLVRDFGPHERKRDSQRIHDAHQHCDSLCRDYKYAKRDLQNLRAEACLGGVQRERLSGAVMALTKNREDLQVGKQSESTSTLTRGVSQSREFKDRV